VEKNCLNCGSTFEKDKRTSLKNWNRKVKFCSKKCASDFRKGNPLSHLSEYQFKKGVSTWNKGLTKKDHPGLKRVSDLKKGDLNPMRQDEAKRKSSQSHKGKKPSVATRLKKSLSMKKVWDKKGRSGQERKSRAQDLEYRQWRMAVFTRDNFTCQFCRTRGCYIEAHHVKSWSKYPALRYDQENGVTLCKECHKLTKNYGRKGKL